MRAPFTISGPKNAARILAMVSGLFFSGSVARAQLNYTCTPPKNSNEAKLLAFFATPIAFSPGGIVEGLAPWNVRVGFEASYVPSPSKEMQQPEACYTVKKTENTNLSPVFPRPRVTIGLPGGLLLEGSYLPPIKVADAKPNLGSVALSWPHRLSGDAEHGSLSMLLRAHGTFGKVEGSITCPLGGIRVNRGDVVAAALSGRVSVPGCRVRRYQDQRRPDAIRGGRWCVVSTGRSDRGDRRAVFGARRRDNLSYRRSLHVPVNQRRAAG